MQNALEVYLTAINELIANSELEPAMEWLQKFNDEYQIGLDQDITLQMAQYNRAKTMFRQGLMDNKDLLQQANRTSFNLTELLKDAPRKIDLNARLKGLKGGSSVNILTEKATLEKIIGSNSLLKIAWLEQALRASKAVCRIIFENGKAEGTGFLSDGNYLYTNNHVIDSREKAAGMRAQFNFEFGLDGQDRETVLYEFDTTDFITSPFAELDFTRIKLKDRADKPLSQWGKVQFAPNAAPSLNDPVNIIQHPDGRDKEIALRANEVVQVKDQYIHYLADTEGGSSGSPVFNQNWQVIALHHGFRNVIVNGVSQPANEGILFRHIFEKIQGGSPPAGVTQARGGASAQPESASSTTPTATTPPPASGRPPKFLVLYEDTDEKYSALLNDHLTPLKRKGKIVVKNLHSDLGAGDPVEFAKTELADADYVLCLVTRSFISGDWVAFAEEASKNGKKIIPLRVTSVDIKETGLERFGTLPSGGRTVPAFGDEDAAYADIVKGLSRLV